MNKDMEAMRDFGPGGGNEGESLALSSPLLGARMAPVSTGPRNDNAQTIFNAPARASEGVMHGIRAEYPNLQNELNNTGSLGNLDGRMSYLQGPQGASSWGQREMIQNPSVTSIPLSGSFRRFTQGLVPWVFDKGSGGGDTHPRAPRSETSPPLDSMRRRSGLHTVVSDNNIENLSNITELSNDYLCVGASAPQDVQHWMTNGRTRRRRSRSSSGDRRRRSRSGSLSRTERRGGRSRSRTRSSSKRASRSLSRVPFRPPSPMPYKGSMPTVGKGGNAETDSQEFPPPPHPLDDRVSEYQGKVPAQGTKRLGSGLPPKRPPPPKFRQE